MNPIIKYVLIYIIFSFLGWIYEYLFFGKKQPDKVIKELFNINIPTLQIYGLGGIILFLINDYCIDCSLIIKVILALVLINLLECVGGRLSYQFFGYQTWEYEPSFGLFCDGYTSIVTSVWWTILSTVFFLIKY